MFAVAGYHAVVCDAFIMTCYLPNNSDVIKNIFLGKTEYLANTFSSKFNSRQWICQALIIVLGVPGLKTE